MRVSVVQMNPGADKARKHRPGTPPDRRGGGRRPPRHRLACRKCGTASAATAPCATPTPRLLPAKGSNEPGGPAYEFLRETARAAKVHVHGGSIIEQGPEKLFNTTVVFDPDGSEIARYRKMHLFDIVAPDGTGYRESNTYGAGDEVVTYEADGIKVGCAICYDLRFPDLFWKLREQGAEVIFLPSAFTLATGKDHWEVMIRSPRDRDAVLVRRPRHLGQAPGRQGRAALHLRPLDDRRSLGPRRRARCRTAPAGPPRGSTTR